MANSSTTEYGDDCVLMLKMDGSDASTTFTDVSDTPHTITANGNAQIDTAQSVFGGASGLFDGTGDYLSAPDNDDFTITGAFTIDFRVRYSSVGTSGFVEHYQNGSNHWIIYFASNTIRLVINGSQLFAKSWTPSSGTWYHIAMTRDGSNDYRVFVDGTQAGTTTNSATALSSSNYAGTLKIGRTDEGGVTQDLNGWLDEFRIVKGQAIWTANFTPPASAYVADGSGAGGLAVLGRRPIRSHYRGVMR